MHKALHLNPSTARNQVWLVVPTCDSGIQVEATGSKIQGRPGRRSEFKARDYMILVPGLRNLNTRTHKQNKIILSIRLGLHFSGQGP